MLLRIAHEAGAILDEITLDPIAGALVSEAELEQTIDAWFSEEASARRRLLSQRMAEKLAKTTIARGS